jgi:hypothetical protein
MTDCAAQVSDNEHGRLNTRTAICALNRRQLVVVTPRLCGVKLGRVSIALSSCCRLQSFACVTQSDQQLEIAFRPHRDISRFFGDCALSSHPQRDGEPRSGSERPELFSGELGDAVMELC